METSMPAGVHRRVISCSLTLSIYFHATHNFFIMQTENDNLIGARQFRTDRYFNKSYC
jgi:hypothetical protein